MQFIVDNKLSLCARWWAWLIVYNSLLEGQAHDENTWIDLKITCMHHVAISVGS